MRHASLDRRSALAAGLALLAAGSSRAADPGVSATELLIGQNITLQGGKNAYGVEVLAGIKTLLDEVNRGGGLFGRRLVLKTLDDENQSAKAEANARQLVEGGAFLLFGSLEGGPSTAVAKVAEATRVPLFGPMAGSPTLRRPHMSMVFPVRAEHREEFRALIRYGASVGLRRVGFFHADSEVGRLHLANVRLAAQENGVELGAALPFKSDISDLQLDDLVAELGGQKVDMVLNHGSAGVYERLIRKARAAASRATFLAVNSGSTQLAAALGPLALGMVFAQVVPSPWARKTAIAREYQEAFGRAHPGREYSYGSLEGYLTTKALVLALRLAGAQPSRAGFVKALDGATLDLGGVRARYRNGEHTGSEFVDLAMVTREGRFLQ
ncbi:MAG: ABC transporter substrate-binding protein [Piscinibacter sp.]|uniref:ABC transporter substrate-binding protein n=1 Tax=Piscinibacter TaxID=1114981 RepID=UPI000FDDC7C5|nr:MULTISPECIES: ABC transporter substrate-binding protein [Piscinibacter]MCW5665351.1 ABC transporter substrate-binding protein [Piscinibacter sp.]